MVVSQDTWGSRVGTIPVLPGHPCSTGLEFLAKRNLTITFFVVGQDAALAQNCDALKAIAAAGHEIGNHSFNHEPWLARYSRDEVEKDIAAAEEHLTRVAGHRPVGFRGPGFSLSETTLEVLAARGYLYDASTLPTFLGPLARAYYFLHSRLNREELKQRNALFGSLRDGIRPLTPYRWKNKDGLLEMPLTTMPIFRSPIHMSYVLYLSTVSRSAALGYFRMAMALCTLMGISPLLLLHPLDFLGHDDGVGLKFFPAMSLSSEQKISLVSHTLAIYCDRFQVLSLKEHARRVVEGSPTCVISRYLPA